MPKKATTTPAAADAAPAVEAAAPEAAKASTRSRSSLPATVTVRVLCAAILEAGKHYSRGETFETTPERANGLGTLVTTKLD